MNICMRVPGCDLMPAPPEVARVIVWTHDQLVTVPGRWDARTETLQIEAEEGDVLTWTAMAFPISRDAHRVRRYGVVTATNPFNPVCRCSATMAKAYVQRRGQAAT